MIRIGSNYKLIGKLVKTTRKISGWQCQMEIKEWERWNAITPTGWNIVREIPEGTICMFLGCDSQKSSTLPQERYVNIWMDLVVEDKVLRVFKLNCLPEYWMSDFILCTSETKS